MKRFQLWLLAVLITLGSAVYQRMTGPTHPLRGKAPVGDTEIRFRFPRSAESVRDCEVAFAAPEPLTGHIEYRRYKTDDPWTRVPLVRKGGNLAGELPKQPAAGKLAYRVFAVSGEVTRPITGEEPVVIRFKDPVPTGLIVIHVLFMFAGMLSSTAAGLSALSRKRNPRRLVLWTVGLLFVGGFILGPLVQKYAFGMFWSGFPFGTDLTDNKTVFSFLLWIVAAAAGRKGRPARPLVLLASIVTLVIYLIPHSLFGSEIDYTKLR